MIQQVQVGGTPANPYRGTVNLAAGSGLVLAATDAANQTTITIGSGGSSVQAITAASSVAPTSNFCRIGGATDIATITVPTSFGANVGILYIIPDTGATWHFLTSGNVGIASTAVVGKVYTMIYDPGVSKWYPSY